jgi:isopenicillin N synthase-like dioxygenase
MVLIDPNQIPIIDLAKLDKDFDGVANEIKEVAATWGFLYVKNTGIEQEKIDRMFEIVSFDLQTLLFKNHLLRNFTPGRCVFQ